jgi:hypothetical protein
MALLTKQKIAVYYDLFKSIDVTFSKEIIQVTGLVPNQIYMKCVGDFWPCVIYSSSFQGAKAVVNIKSGILQKLERANNMVSLRFCFKIADKGNPVAFFINTKAAGYSSYGGSEDMALFNLQFTQRPPDDLIEIMGRILDANVNSAKRREDRILITAESIRKLNLVKETSIFIQGVPRHCILRDLSFSGVKIIMMGVAKFLADRDAILKLDFEDPRESFLLKGKFIRSETVEGRKELVSLVIHFDESVVPMGYKIRINDYLSQIRLGEKPSSGELPVSPVSGHAAGAQNPGNKNVVPAPQKKTEQAPPAQSQKKEAGLPAQDVASGTTPAKPAAPANDSFDLNLPS